MGCLTAKASGSVASFITPTVTPIESARVYFGPTQLGEGTPSPENVREIVGRTDVELKQCGKNLIPPLTDDNFWNINGYVKADGSIALNAVYRTCDYQKAIPNKKYTISSKKGMWFGICFFDTSYNVCGFIEKSGFELNITSPQNAVYYRVYVKYNLTDDVQLEIGDKTPCKPYQGTTIPFSWKRMPDEYQEVEWIKSDGNQYIDTGIIFNHGIKITAQMGFVEKSNSKTLFGVRLDTSATRFLVTYYNGLDFAYWNDIMPFQPDIDTIYNIVFDTTQPQKFIYGVDESFWQRNITELTSDITGYIFAYHRKSDNSVQGMSRSYFKSMMIENSNGECIFNGIPCYRKSDNEIGIYDIMSQTFLTNLGTGTFTKGDDVTSDVFSDEVYGGYVDLVKGEIVDEYYSVPYTAWSVYKQNNGYICYKAIQQPDHLGHWYCNVLNTYGSFSSNAMDRNIIQMHGSTLDSTGTVYMALDENIDISTVQVIYKRAVSVPVTHPLPDYLKTQLQTLKNENTFWSDADSVEIDYGLAETFDIQKAKRKIIMNQPHVETVSGDVVSFTTDMKAPLKECKVSFMPVQEGSGDPSPSNVRNITGWNGVSVTRCKKNLIIEDDPLNPNANYGHNSTGVTKYSEEEQGFYDEPPGISYTAHATGKNGLSYDKVRLFIAPSDMTVVFSIEYKNVGTTYGIRLYKSSSRLTDIHGNADSTWHRYSQVITLSKGDYLKLLIYDKIYWRNIQVEIANSVTDYESYQGTTYSIDWTDEVGTVYGGYVDLIKGELVDEYYSVPYTAWSVYKQNNGYICYKAIQQPDHLGHWYCNVLNTYGSFSSNAMDRNIIQMHGSTLDSTGTVYMALDENIDISTVQVIYKRAVSVPVTYQLTPQQILSLKGQNNLWADTNGTTEIKFWKH